MEVLSNKNETVRLFNSGVLESFSHVHPLVPFIIFLPVVTVSSFFAKQSFGFAIFTTQFLVGLFFWTFIEYVMHRFVFHFAPSKPFFKQIMYLVHGIHHAYPRDATRLVMPPILSIPLSVLFWIAFKGVFGTKTYGLFAGFIFGYLIYDFVHYAVHHFELNKKWMQSLRQNHLRHHYQDQSQSFGVSSVIWDKIFGS